MGTRPFDSFSYPTYHAYYAQGVPYTYQPYSSAYYPAGGVPSTSTNPAALPITPQRYYQQLPAYPS